MKENWKKTEGRDNNEENRYESLEWSENNNIMLVKFRSVTMFYCERVIRPCINIKTYYIVLGAEN